MDIAMIDTHIHIRGYHNLKDTLAIAEEISKRSGLKAWNVLALTAWDADSVGQNVLCIACKALYPEAYAYAGIDHFYDGIDKTAAGRKQQIKEFIAMGFDGIKLIESKPSSRKFLQEGLDGGEYEELFDYLEEEQIPIVWHVADPEENWDEEACGEYAKEHGWYYGDGTFLLKEELYEEVFRVLDKHPKLNVTFAHMFFLSKDVERARKILDKWQNIKFDLTPGLEMYYNFDENYQEWKKFFLDYQDRIIFGTDNGWGDEASPEEKIKDGCRNLTMLKEYFATPNEVRVWNGKMLKGMDLPETVLDKIFCLNFEKAIGGEKKPIAVEKVMEYGNNILMKIENRNDIKGETKEQLKELLHLLKEI